MNILQKIKDFFTIHVPEYEEPWEEVQPVKKASKTKKFVPGMHLRYRTVNGKEEMYEHDDSLSRAFDAGSKPPDWSITGGMIESFEETAKLHPDPNRVIVCCGKTFKTFKGWRTHRSRVHKRKK